MNQGVAGADWSGLSYMPLWSWDAPVHPRCERRWGSPGQGTVFWRPNTRVLCTCFYVDRAPTTLAQGLAHVRGSTDSVLFSLLPSRPVICSLRLAGAGSEGAKGNWGWQRSEGGPLPSPTELQRRPSLCGAPREGHTDHIMSLPGSRE